MSNRVIPLILFIIASCSVCFAEDMSCGTDASFCLSMGAKCPDKIENIFRSVTCATADTDACRKAVAQIGDQDLSDRCKCSREGTCSYRTNSKKDNDSSNEIKEGTALAEITVQGKKCTYKVKGSVSKHVPNKFEKVKVSPPDPNPNNCPDEVPDRTFIGWTVDIECQGNCS